MDIGDETMLRLLQSAMYGEAIGDALGVPYEGRMRDTFTCITMTCSEAAGIPAGTFSDDTSMALATLDSLMHRDGVVTECAHSNVQILKDGVLYAHPNDEFILRGIAKTHLIQAAYRAAIPVIERAFTLDELHDADEVIVTSSSALCLFANELDGKPVGGRDPQSLRTLQEITYREYREYCGL